MSTSVLAYPFKPVKNIVESQLIQEEPGSVIVKIVKSSSFSNQDSHQLIEGLKERLGDSIEIKVVFVDHIPREAPGKFRWVISKIQKA